MNEKTFELPKESVEGFSHFVTINEKVYDVYKLIELAKTIEPKIVPIEIFDNNKNEKHWDINEDVLIGPSDIIDSLKKTAGSMDWDDLIKEHPEWGEHIESIRKGDYEMYPIIYTGEDIIVDGLHRLTKAWIDKVEEIKTKRMEELPDSAIYKEPTK